ncbi:uncharacterized protein LOC144442651 [Glandiceps talaboti]
MSGKVTVFVVCVVFYAHLTTSSSARSGTREDVILRYIEDLTQDFNSLKAEYANLLSEMNSLRTGLARQAQFLVNTVTEPEKEELEILLAKQAEKIEELEEAFVVQESTVSELLARENTRRRRHQGNNNIAVSNDYPPVILERQNKRVAEKRANILEEVESSRGTRKVAFSATRTASLLGETTPQVITFHDMFVNEGGDFDAEDGIFTCSVSGVYYFSFTMRSYDNNYIGVILMKDEEPQVSMATDADDRSLMQTQTVVLALQVGDTVWLRLSPSKISPVSHAHRDVSDGYAIYGNSYNYITFNGFLIFGQ